MSVEQRADPVQVAVDWFQGVITDTKSRTALRRARSLQDFKESWYLASLLAKINHPKTDQLVTSIWGASVAKSVCEGSLASVARSKGINEKHWRKLTSTASREEAARQVRRITRQLDAVPVKDVIEKLFYWGPRARRDWATAWFRIESDESDAA